MKFHSYSFKDCVIVDTDITLFQFNCSLLIQDKEVISTTVAIMLDITLSYLN